MNEETFHWLILIGVILILILLVVPYGRRR